MEAVATELVATAMPSERAWFRQTRDAYVEWFEPLPVRLWLTVNAREPLYQGSWRHVVNQASEIIETASGLTGQTTWLGVCESNRDRNGFHLHALGLGGRALLEPRRTGPGGLIERIEGLVRPLHASYREYRRDDDNAAGVTLKAVQRFGNGQRSLTAYWTKTLHAYMRKDTDSDWFEVGAGLKEFLAPTKELVLT